MTSCRSIVIILRECQEGELVRLCRTSHSWVVDLPSNRDAARQFWAGNNSEDLNCLGPGATLFTPVGSTREEQLANVMDTIADHHPDWTELTVFGIKVSQTIRELMASYGVAICRELSDGFSARCETA